MTATRFAHPSRTTRRAGIGRRTVPLLLSLLCLSTSLSAQATTAERIGGEWVFQMDGDDQPQRVVLTVERDSLRGRVYGQDLVGALRGARVEFRVGGFRWRGTLRGDTLTGWLGVGSDSSAWSGQRFRAPAVGRAFDLAPTTFHRGLSATAPPALRINARDTVRTTTLDAGGWGRGAFGDRLNKRSPGGNPLTGPFYVEGAVPGDVLVVRLHRVRLNRDWAFSGTQLIDNAIDARYAVDRKTMDIDNKWTLDTLTQTARLTTPTPGLADFRVPLRPFLGVIAVAPGGSFVPTSRDSGPYGGNMEYAQLREGTTLYLPVSTMGAYLYLGDGHAAQGDGELTGDAMETALDVTFSVDIKRWGFAAMPRAESAEHIMSIGTAGSLDEAMRRATTDLARWIEADYDVTATDVALIMGFAVIYDIPDLVPPTVGVSARIPKSALATLARRKR
jgi:amidase